MVRQELTILERAEQIVQRKKIYETLHPETRHGNGPGRGRREKKRNEFVSFAADTASKTGCTPRTIQQAVQIATNLSDRVKERIRTLPIADKQTDLLRLVRLPQETQEAIAHQLASGSAKSLREAQRALNADAGAPDSKPDTRWNSQGETSDPLLTSVERDGEDQDTLLHSIVARLMRHHPLAEGQIAGQPAADVLVTRLATLPWAEVVLLTGLVRGPMPRAAEAWIAAVREDVQDKELHFEGVMPHDCAGKLANDPAVPLTSIDDQAKDSACSVSSAHASIGNNACSEGQRTSTAVMEVRGDDGADAEVRAATDQLSLPWSGEEQAPPVAPNMPARGVEPKDSSARTRTQRSKAEVSAASTMGELTRAQLRVRGLGQTAHRLKASVDPGEPEVHEMVETVLTPTHPDPVEAWLDEPFTGTFNPPRSHRYAQFRVPGIVDVRTVSIQIRLHRRQGVPRCIG